MRVSLAVECEVHARKRGSQCNRPPGLLTRRKARVGYTDSSMFGR